MCALGMGEFPEPADVFCIRGDYVLIISEKSPNNGL